jgi:hypothetical protein
MAFGTLVSVIEAWMPTRVGGVRDLGADCVAAEE